MPRIKVSCHQANFHNRIKYRIRNKINKYRLKLTSYKKKSNCNKLKKMVKISKQDQFKDRKSK